MKLLINVIIFTFILAAGFFSVAEAKELTKVCANFKIIKTVLIKDLNISCDKILPFDKLIENMNQLNFTATPLRLKTLLIHPFSEGQQGCRRFRTWNHFNRVQSG